MADLGFLHGVEVISVDRGPRPIQTQRSAIIGLIGTAPLADAALFPLDTPVLVNSRSNYAAIGATGTLKDALDGIFDQFSPFVVVIRVAEGENAGATVANIIGEANVDGSFSGVLAFRESESLTGVQPMLLIAPGFTGERPTGVSAIAVTTPGTGYTSAPAVAFSGGSGTGAAGTAVLTNGIAATLGVGGTGYSTAPTVVIAAPPVGGEQATATAAVSAGAVSAITVTNPGKGYLTPPAISFTGGGGTGATATAALTGRVGSVLISNPGRSFATAPTIAFSGGGGSSAAATASIAAGPNPVVTALLPLANQFRAHIIAEGPSTTDAAALAYRGDWGTRRVYIVDPKVKVYDTVAAAYVSKPNSARVAGLIARIDHEIGFWKSPSNEVINGIGGTDRAIDWSLGDPNTRANLLNENEVATFIRDEGYRLWGNRTASDDPIYAFLSVSRTKDLIDLSIQKAHRYAVDKVINKAYFEDVVASVNGYLRQLQTRGAILGGKCWVDPEKNADADIQAGHVTFSYDFTPPTPAERVTFESSIVADYVINIFG